MNIILPIAITLAVMVVLLAALSLTLAYRSRLSSPTSPYTLARPDAKVARLGYWSMQQGRRVTPEPPACPPPVPTVPDEKESA